MSRIVDVEPLDCLAWKDGEHGTTFDDGVLWVLEKIGELPAVQTCEDAVSRQAAIDAWKADFKGYVDCLDLLRDDYNGIMEYIDEAPSAQPDIIRCKDCYWWTKQEDSLQGRCDRYGMYPTGYWYCAAARERREE